MERLNAFIVSNKPALGRFYDQIVDHPDRGKLTDITVRLLCLQFKSAIHLTLPPTTRCRHGCATTHSSSCARFWRPAWRPTSVARVMTAKREKKWYWSCDVFCTRRPAPTKCDPVSTESRLLPIGASDLSSWSQEFSQHHDH